MKFYHFMEIIICGNSLFLNLKLKSKSNESITRGMGRTTAAG